MERKIENKLLEWKNDPYRKPLILQGARQVGKTYTTLSFGKKYYRSCVYFNFENNSELAKIFDRDMDPERIVMELSAKSGQTILKGETLIFFDEIQACERALTSLKYFQENANEYHIIAVGSLLGVALNRDKYSFPVGKINFMNMYPLDFEEFLTALGQEKLSNAIKDSFYSNAPLSLHDTAMDYYRKYLLTGGMPSVVVKYIDKQDFDFVRAEQKNINDSYIADMAKYATPHETTKIMAAFESIPAQLAKENKKFQYKVIKTGAKANQYETPIDWLKSSGIIIKCHKVNEGSLPLKAYCDFSSFKIYMADVGLLTSKFDIPANIILSGNTHFDRFKGALAENYVAQSLVTNGHNIFYWESNGKAEIDFVMQDKEGNIIPVEVKSGEHTKSKSLGVFCSRYQCDYSIRISGKNFGFENGIKSVPLYAAGLI